MRILALSDLHLDYIRLRNGLGIDEEMEIVKILLEKISSENADIFIFAGDISAKLWEIELFFKGLKAFSGIKVFLPGNHDLWREGNVSSDEKYYKKLPELCANYGFFYLPQGFLEINGLVIVGTTGWYDYSFGSDYYEEKIFEKGEYKGIRWRETYWKLIDFNRNGMKLGNKEICELMLSQFRDNLVKVSNYKDIIAVTHFLPFEELLSIKNFFSAYLGTKKLEEIILQHNIKRVICGHEHRYGIYNIKNIEIYKPTFGYLDDPKKVKEKIEKTSIVIEVSDYNRFSVI
ncbi:MAG: metallophosphoesterase [Dictyoglomus sp.]